MSVTKKFIISAGAGALIIPFTGGASAAIFIAYNCVLFALLALDFCITPKAAVFDIWRPAEYKLFFKAVNTVSFHVRNNYKLPLELTLKDELPDFHFEILKTDMKKVVPAHGEAIFSYDTRPAKRGAFMFANVYIKFKSRWGLCYKYAKRPLAMDFKVYPNLKDLSKYRLLVHKSMALENGKRIINTRGRGQEVESLREYADGDDIRTVNWMVSARERKYVVNLYESEKNQPVYIMLDTGRPMSYLLKGYKKLDYAINAALILSDIVNQRGDNSGLAVFGVKMDAFLKPGKGPMHRNEVMETLYHIKDTNKTSDYYDVFKEFVSRQKRRSIVFIFTDFETEVEQSDLVSQIAMLKGRHLPVVALMKNDSVIRMSENAAKDAKGIYEKSAALEYLDHRQSLIRALNMNGIACIESDSEDFAIDAVNRYIKIKAERGL
jgi:uncharacterized protein (DUF58 family)